MQGKNLIQLIKDLEKKIGNEAADNMLAGILIVKKDYFSIKSEIERVLEE